MRFFLIFASESNQMKCYQYQGKTAHEILKDFDVLSLRLKGLHRERKSILKWLKKRSY